jgi:hypothetical protein
MAPKPEAALTPQPPFGHLPFDQVVDAERISNSIIGTLFNVISHLFSCFAPNSHRLLVAL